ncbi:MAG: zinc ribbon domain-containing protein [Gammaproteobacteria bacterium]|nr:zinc ribbon domain-containing protein [Gammaproteobacteria bacterium]
MPIYEYRCNACGHEMEIIQKMADDPMKDCPVCKESKLKKLISAAGFRLKGSGWYETDFKNNKKAKKDSSSGHSGGSCGGGGCGCAS